MQIESLKTFCDLVETESFTKAAQVNGVTQSAVSQTVSTMERHFQSLLGDRSKRQFRLTREGQVVYDHAKQIIAAAEALDHKIQEVKEIMSGTIRVGAIYSIGLHTLPAYLKLFLKDQPAVKVQVEYLRFDQLREAVLENLLDLGLVAYPAPEPRLAIVPLRKEPLVMICHPQNPLAKLESVQPKALHGQKFVSFAPDLPTRRAVDRLLRLSGAQVQQVMQFENVETVKRAVEIDAGIAIVPAVTVLQEAARGTLVAVKIASEAAARPVAAIYKKHRALSPAMEEFLAVLKRSL